MTQGAESVWCRLARISRRTRSDRSPFRSNADDLFACSLQALRSHRDQSGMLRRSPMSATEVATIIKLQPTARAYRIIPLCTRGRSICLQQTELIASCELLSVLLYPAPSRTLRSPGPLWTRLRAGRASPLFATRALTLPPSVPLIRRTLFTCGRVNPIAPSIAGRRREYQRSKRARLFRREYFKQSSSNFQIYLYKELKNV